MDEEDLIDFAAQPRVEGLGGLRLPTFWVDKPASWFIMAESWFRLHGINREQNRYDYLVAALSKEAVSLVLDIVENPPKHHLYTALKERLLESHQLNDYQRVSLLFRMEPLGGRKPSELLAAMLELCPRGHETSIFFTHLFLERLPAELRILLGEDDHQNPRDVAKKADSLWALHKMNLLPGAAVASVEGSSSLHLQWPLLEPQRWQQSPPVARVAVVGDPGAEAVEAAGAGPLGFPVVVPSLRPEVSRRAACPRPLLLFARRTWLGFSRACASITSTSVSRPTTVSPPATGETSCPGASRRRSSRPAGPYYGPVITKAFPGRHRSRLFSVSAFFNQLSKRPGLVWCGWSAYPLLGGQAPSSLLWRP
jgi:hypothetical protein